MLDNSLRDFNRYVVQVMDAYRCWGVCKIPQNTAWLTAGWSPADPQSPVHFLNLPVLSKHSLIVWWMKIGVVRICKWIHGWNTRNPLNQIKHCHTRAICKKKILRHGPETNTALHFMLCCIGLLTMPLMLFFSILHLQQCFNMAESSLSNPGVDLMFPFYVSSRVIDR